MVFTDRTAGYMPGQSGVLGVNYTATFAKSMMADSRLMYVNPNHADATDDGNTGENPEQPFLTVAAALLRTRDNRGDVILVGQNDAWQYGGGSTWQTPIAEEVTITTEGVSLIGVSPGSLGVTWHPVTAAGAGTCITVNAMDVFISGFTFEGGALGGIGIHAIWNGTTLFGENLVVQGCFFDSGIDIGIQLEYSWFARIHGCTFEACDFAGIYNDPTDSDAAYAHIYDNTFIDVGLGTGATGAISFQGVTDCYIYNNRIYNSNAEAANAATDEGIDTAGGDRNLVSDNWFSCVLTDTAANGDWGEFNSGAATDAWVGNHCTTGIAVNTPDF